MGVSSRLHALAALPPENSLWYPLDWGQVGPRAGLDAVAGEGNPCP